MAMRIFLTSIPKSGMHLLVSAFKSLGFETFPVPKKRPLTAYRLYRDGNVMAYGHWRYTEETATHLAALRYSVIVLIRDPRDLCLSVPDVLVQGKPAAAHRLAPTLATMPKDALFRGMVSGMQVGDWHQAPIRKTASGWLPWVRAGAVLLRYEDLCTGGAADVFGLPLRNAVAERYRAYNAARGRGLPYRWRSEFRNIRTRLAVVRLQCPPLIGRVIYEMGRALT